MRVPRTSSAGRLEVKMTPMIDVVFLLLVFFVWTSSFDIPELDLPSSLATPPSGSSSLSETDFDPEPFDEIVIRLIDDSGVPRIQLNDDMVVDLQRLQLRLAGILRLGIQPPVIIDPDDNITMELAIEAYDVARQAGADRVLFAADVTERD